MNGLLKGGILCFLIMLLSCSSDGDSSGSEDQETSVEISISDFSITINENPDAGFVLGQIEASTNQGSISFSIASENPSGALQITSSGMISVANASLFDYETRETITATIEARIGNVTRSANISIALLDLLENPFLGNAIFNSQQDVDDFGSQNYDHITGALQIMPISSVTDVNDLTPLLALKKINNGIFIHRSPDLNSLNGLDNLKYIGGLLKITVNEQLSDISSLSKLDTIPGVLHLAQNPSIKSLSGLENLKSIEDGFFLNDMTGVRNIDELINVNNFQGGLIMRNNTLLENLDGFVNATGELTALSISNNTSLTSISGLSNLGGDDLGQCGVIDNVNLINIVGLESITGSDEIIVSGNSAINDLNGLVNLELVTYNVSFIENQILGDFCGLVHLANEGTIGGIYDSRDNLYNPTIEDISNGDCSL
ncbi:MAG: cadherin repeat domain-containing protein [Flavobacteriaceae bacterium]|nr:cadherin repeat domain-containing protein [Flavobacteriaceae bacterium]